MEKRNSTDTRAIIIPAIELLKREGENFIVTDYKGEIHRKTAGDLWKFGYKSLVINFYEFNRGYKWNPLSLAYDYYHDHCETKAIEIAGMIADMILGDTTKTDSDLVGMAKDVMVGVMLLLAETASRDECNIRNLITLWNFYIKDRSKFRRHIQDKYGSSMVELKLAGLYNSPEKTISLVEAVVNGAINGLTVNEDFIDFMSCSTAGFEVIERKTAVYIIVPDGPNNSLYHVAASILINQIYDVLTKCTQKHKNHRLPIRTNFIFDESVNLPPIPNLEAMITTSESHNIRFMMDGQFNTHKECSLKELPKGKVLVISEDDFYKEKNKNNRKLYGISVNEIKDLMGSVAEEKENLLDMKTYMWKATLIIREYDKPYREIELLKLETEDSMAGLECMLDKAFRMANEQIGDNVFAKVEWRLDRQFSCDKHFVFSKCVSTMRVASLMVEREDYLLTRKPVEYYPDERDYL